MTPGSNMKKRMIRQRAVVRPVLRCLYAGQGLCQDEDGLLAAFRCNNDSN